MFRSLLLMTTALVKNSFSSPHYCRFFFFLSKKLNRRLCNSKQKLLTPSACGNNANAGTKNPNCPKFSTEERLLRLRNFSWILCTRGIEFASLHVVEEGRVISTISSLAAGGASLSRSTVKLVVLSSVTWEVSFSAIIKLLPSGLLSLLDDETVSSCNKYKLVWLRCLILHVTRVTVTRCYIKLEDWRLTQWTRISVTKMRRKN